MTVLFNPLNLFISLQKAFCKPATVLFLYLKAVHLPDLSFSFKGRGLLLWVGGSGGGGVVSHHTAADTADTAGLSILDRYQSYR